jgi:tetratricopeptide (TPR) repeat protein
MLGALLWFAPRARADAWMAQAEQARDRLQARAAQPEAIADIGAMARHEDFLPQDYLGRVLGDLLDRPARQVDSLVRAQAGYLLSLDDDRHGRFELAEKRRGELGFANDFWVLGPMDAQGRGGLARAFAVEEEGTTLDPRAGRTYAGKERSVSWRRVPAQAVVQGAVVLDALLRPDNDVVGYLLTYVTSDRDGWAALRMGSPGPIKVWLGGKEVLKEDVVRSAYVDQVAAPVYLRRGTTPLLIKSVLTRGAWRVFVRVTDAHGDAVPGVSFSAEVPVTPAVAAARAGGHPPMVRELGALLRKRAERAARAKTADAAAAWLDLAYFLSLVGSADNELRAVEETAKKAVPPAEAKDAPLSPVAVDALLLMGTVAREEDDRRAALERALPAISDPEQKAMALATLARTWRHQRREASAVATWREALARDPNCVLAQLGLARQEEHAGMEAAALARLSSLPPSARALLVVKDAIADALVGLGRRAEAETIRREILAVRRTDTSALRDLANALRTRGELAEAARLNAEAARVRPELTSLVYDQAGAHEARGDLASARAVLRAAMERLPDDPGLPEELGRLEARAGHFDAAVTTMRRSLELRPQNPTLRRYMEALAAEREAKPTDRSANGEERSVDALARAYALDGEALANEALRDPSPTDDASTEILLHRVVVRVHPNGLSERFVQQLVRVRTERAARDGHQSWVRYEPGRQEVEIRKARILRKGEGGRIEISEAVSRDERELSEPWYGLYYDSRATIVSMENLRAGDIIEVQYTLADVAYANELADYFGDIDTIAGTSPTRRWDYILIAPSARAFYFNHAAIPGLGPVRESAGGETVYRFHAEKVPRIQSEPAMPGLAEVAPYLHVSTYAKWNDVGRWYWNLVADQMKDDGSLAQAAAHATVGLSGTLDIVKALHRLVLERTRYVGLEFGIHGYKPYKSTEVLRRGFGDCKDKAALLVALLREKGIASELVLLRTRREGQLDPSPASLAVFNHAIVYVPALELYLDGTAEFSGLGELPAEDQDSMALRVSARAVELVRTPMLPAPSNLAARAWNVTVEPTGGARIREELTITGQAAHEWRSHYQTPGERRERYAKVWSGRYAGAVLGQVTMEVGDRNRPVTVRAEVTVPELGGRQASGQLFLPVSSREADFTSTYARLGKRRWPLVLGYPWRHQEKLSYTLPAGARIVRTPAPRTLTTPFGQLSLVSQIRPDGSGITLTSGLAVDVSRIEPSTYPAFRAFLQDIDAALADKVVVELEKKP